VPVLTVSFLTCQPVPSCFDVCVLSLFPLVLLKKATFAEQSKVTESLKKYVASCNQTEDDSQTNFLAEITRGGGGWMGDASSLPHVVTVRVHADFVDPLAQQQMTLELGNGVARGRGEEGEGTVYCVRTLVGGDLE
jgi:hypothetical protein